MAAQVVMLGYIELMPGFSMDCPGPTRVIFHDMTVGKNLVPSNKDTGSNSYLITV